jgi:putative alpha-1,2-mannosidase
VSFNTGKREKINARVASSFISFEQAELNLKRELANVSLSKPLQLQKRVE